jgi:hypothetical protein
MFFAAGIRFIPALPVASQAAHQRQMTDFPPPREKSSWNPYAVIL